MNILRISVVAALFALAASVFGQDPVAKPASESSTILGTWSMIEKDFTSSADAVPEEKYSFVPSAESSKARNFAQQVGHVACANFAFFQEFEGTKPDEDCRYNGKEPKKSKSGNHEVLRMNGIVPPASRSVPRSAAITIRRAAGPKLFPAAGSPWPICL